MSPVPIRMQHSCRPMIDGDGREAGTTVRRSFKLDESLISSLCLFFLHAISHIPSSQLVFLCLTAQSWRQPITAPEHFAFSRQGRVFVSDANSTPWDCQQKVPMTTDSTPAETTHGTYKSAFPFQSKFHFRLRFAAQGLSRCRDGGFLQTGEAAA